MTRLGLRACRSDLVFEDSQGQKPEILLHAKGRGKRGGYGLLKGRLMSWLNARFFCAWLL